MQPAADIETRLFYWRILAELVKSKRGAIEEIIC